MDNVIDPTQSAPPAQNEEERLRMAFERADAQLAAQGESGRATAGAERRAGKGIIEKGLDAWKSAGVGIAKAGFETKDFFMGEPTQDEKGDLRKGIEKIGQDLADESVVNSLSSGVAQMVTGIVGAGKILAPVKVFQKLGAAGKAGRLAQESIKAAVGSTFVLDPHEERLSDLIEEFPSLQNPVTDYLASDPEDSAAEGRFKNALESLGVDLALIGAVKVVKFLKGGNKEAAVREIAKMEKAKGATPEAAADDGFDEVDFSALDAPAVKGEPNGTYQDATGKTRKLDANGWPVGTGAAVKGKPKAAVKGKPQDAPVSTIEQVGTKQRIGPDGQPLLPEQTVAKEVKVADIPDDEIDSILKATEADKAAITKYGTRSKAARAGHTFGNTSKNKLPWQKLHAAGGAKELLERTTQVLTKRGNLAKGGAVMSDKRVEALAKEYTETYGEDPAFVIGALKEAGEAAAQMVPQMEAALRIGTRMFQEVDQLRINIRNGNLADFGGNAELAQQEFVARLGLALDTLSAGGSIRSNSGRALRRNRSEFRLKKGDLERISALPADKLMLVLERADGDLKMVSKLLNETWTRRVMSEATWHLTNGLLWMWPTHLVNLTTNTFMLAARPAEKWFGSKVLHALTSDPAKRAELSTMARQARQEYLFTITSLSDGWSNAIEAFKAGDSILNPHNTEYFDGTVTGIPTSPLKWKPVNSVWDLAENAWMAASYRTLAGMPTRGLGAQDEFYKTLRYRAVVQSRAAVEAADRGLDGADLKEYVRKALEQSVDPANGRALDTNAMREAQKVSFQQDLNYDTYTGSLGRGLQNLRKTAPLTSFVVPFLKTPINVIRYGIKMTPGLNMLQKEFTDELFGKAGAEAQAHAVGQMAMGSMFMGLAAHLTLNDQFTGSGPADYKLKQELIATGWKPYSIKWTDDNGDTQYFQLGRFDPVGMAMGMVADIVGEKQKDPDKDYSDLILAAGVAVAKNLGEKSFLLNLNSAMDAMLDPDARLGTFLGRTAGSMLPASSLMRGHSPDPYLREARGFIDSAIRGVPGLQEGLPIKMDIWGDPIERHVGVTDTQVSDIVDAEHNRIMLQTDKGVGKPSFKIGATDIRDLTLKDGKNAYQRLQELSGHIPKHRSLKEEIGRLISKPAYQDLVDGDSDVQGTRLHEIGKVVHKYRTAAKKYFLKENPELQPLLSQRQKDVKGALLEKRQAKKQEAPGEALLNALSPQ